MMDTRGMYMAAHFFVRLNVPTLKRLNIALQSRRLVIVRRVFLRFLQRLCCCAHRFGVIAIFDLEGHGLTIDAEGFLLNGCVLIRRSDEKSKVIGAIFSNASVQDVDAEFFRGGLNSIHFIFRSEPPKVVVGYVALAVRMDMGGEQGALSWAKTTHLGSPIMRLASGLRQ